MILPYKYCCIVIFVCRNLYWSPKSGAIVYQIRMDDLTDDSNPKIKTLWQDPSLSWSNLTIGGIALSYSTTDDSYDYVYWAVTDEQYVMYNNEFVHFYNTV